MAVRSRCMVVDDEADMRTLACLVIEMADAGLTVGCSVGSGPEAVAAIEVCNPDVVIMDEMMPGMCGLEAVDKIRALRPEQRFVMFSAFVGPELRQRAEALGIRVCLSKQNLDVLPDAVRLAVAN